MLYAENIGLRDCSGFLQIGSQIIIYNNSYAWCLRCNIFSAWFLDIRIYQLVFLYTLGESRKIMLTYSGAAPSNNRHYGDKCSSYHVKIVMNCGSISAKPMQLL